MSFAKKKWTAEEIDQVRHYLLGCERFWKPKTEREKLQERMDQFRNDMAKKMFDNCSKLVDIDAEDSTHSSNPCNDIWSTRYEIPEEEPEERGWNVGNNWGIGDSHGDSKSDAYRSLFGDGYIAWRRGKTEKQERIEGFERWLSAL